MMYSVYPLNIIFTRLFLADCSNIIKVFWKCTTLTLLKLKFPSNAEESSRIILGHFKMAYTPIYVEHVELSKWARLVGLTQLTKQK